MSTNSIPRGSHPLSNNKKARSTDFFSPLRLSRPSTKGKPPVPDDDIYDSPVSPSHSGNGHSLSLETGSVATYHAPPSPAYTIPRPRSASGVHSSTSIAKKRASLLIAASDALGIRFGRKRPSTPVRLPPNAAILPDIVEATTHPPEPDRESEERERLREEAAQLLGIAVDQDTRSIGQTTEEDEMDPDALACHVSSSDNATRSMYTRTDIMNCSSNSLPSPTRPTTFTSHRSGSVMTHNRRTSTPPSIPPFPASFDALQDFKQLSATFPKHYTPTSLRIFALSKQWKLRHLVLTSPLTLITNGSEPAVSYLHVFKSSSAGEFEAERLEINEDSVIFIAEEDIGGRKHVVKVGGRGEGTVKGTIEEGGRTMWLLQICDTAESQKWISTIKNIILGQRTIRAGLAVPTHAAGGPEPRGDMDVMLSIRQQGIVMTPAALRQSTSSPQSLVVDGTYASSISSQSLKSQGTGPKTPTSSASGFKSFFASRPRATSRATSFDLDRENESYPNMNHMLSKLRPGTADSKKSSEKSFVPPLSSFASNFYTLQRRIVREQAAGASFDKSDSERTRPAVPDRMHRSSAHGAVSLQPPPRKRRMSGTVTTPTLTTTTNADPSGESPMDQFSDEPSSGPRFSRFGSPLQRPRVPSVQSVSTIASTDNAASQEHSSISTQRSARRWSRQSTLPARSSPTTGPSPGMHLQPHPFAAEQGIVRTVSDLSIDQNTMPGFTHVSSKRASTASGFSVKSTGTSQSFLVPQGRTSRPSSAHRSSMPPPSKPAPTSALPPAPGQVSASAPAKSSFRESVAVRVGRLSMMASKPAPMASPEPNEKSVKAHRRASSGSYFLKLAQFDPNSSSLASSDTTPAPRPIRPLPPTPTSPETPNLTLHTSQPSQRESLLKRRLRIRSAPATRSTDDIVPASISDETSRLRSNIVTAPIVQTSKIPLISQPSTPIAEKIMTFQNDPTFLQPDTPTISLPPPRPLPPTPEQLPEITSLHPPPRRSSRHIIPSEDYDTAAIPIPTPKAPAVEGEHRLISLSRPGSVVSLGIVSM